MPPETPFDAKEDIRRAIDIVELVGRYISLRREGRGFKGLCPWHQDSRPSLQVNPDRQSFRCWVCNVGGDIFSFMMKMEGIEFAEALQMLAEQAGVTLTRTRGSTPNAQAQKRSLLEVAAWAESEYHRCLLEAPEAEPARSYLADRGLERETWRSYRLGFAPDAWDWLANRARGANVSLTSLETLGLLAPSRTGRGYYERFRARVLFSIRDSQARPVAFGGRLVPGLGGQDAAKYINSPESPLFTKSKLLYGLDSSRDRIGRGEAPIVMEGYTDVLIARQFGLSTSLAVLGTALGEHHLKLLRRYGAEQIVLVLDGDEAGRRRTAELLELFVSEQVDLRILTLPDDLDPCDFLRQRGVEEFRSLVASAPDALEHAFLAATEGLDFGNDTFRANQAVERILHLLAQGGRGSEAASAHRLKEEQILSRLALRARVPEQSLRSRLGSLRRAAIRTTPGPASRETPADATVAPDARRRDLAERWLLGLLLRAPRLVARASSELHSDDFRNPAHAALFAAAAELVRSGVEPTFTHWLSDLEDAELKSLLVSLDEDRPTGSDEATLERELRELIGVCRGQSSEPPSTLPLARAEPAHDLDALRRIIDRERNRQGLSGPPPG